jgi:hypothetical protein
MKAIDVGFNVSGILGRSLAISLGLVVPALSDYRREVRDISVVRTQQGTNGNPVLPVRFPTFHQRRVPKTECFLSQYPELAVFDSVFSKVGVEFAVVSMTSFFVFERLSKVG